MVTRLVPVDGVPRLVLFAKKKINIADELVFDYRDRRKVHIAVLSIKIMGLSIKTASRNDTLQFKLLFPVT